MILSLVLVLVLWLLILSLLLVRRVVGVVVGEAIGVEVAAEDLLMVISIDVGSDPPGCCGEVDDKSDGDSCRCTFELPIIESSSSLSDVSFFDRFRCGDSGPEIPFSIGDPFELEGRLFVRLFRFPVNN